MDRVIALLRETQSALLAQQQLQEQQTSHILKLESTVAALRFLGYALAATHPSPTTLADSYLQLMDHAADKLPATQVQLFRDDMHAVLRELLSLPRAPGSGTPPRSP